jgi:D-glycero-D-manno-heptose 1,7-bisphosphate phosphatase
VFLDRDGTINVRASEHEYITDPSRFHWLPEALAGMVRLAHGGLPLVVVSNQRGVSRGLVSIAVLESIERTIQDALADHGCRVEAFRYCTHALEDGCACRKPRPGMLLDAAGDLDFDLTRSWMVGDTLDDMRAGTAAGCRTILLTDGALNWERTARTVLEAAATVLRDRRDHDQ